MAVGRIDGKNLDLLKRDAQEFGSIINAENSDMFRTP
jgi:hypothetical protein